MEIKWNRLLAREGVDLVTISGIDPIFISAIREFANSDEELFFTHIKGKFFTHYIGVDSKKLGGFLYEKFFNSPEKIKKHYEDGNKLIKKIKKTTSDFKSKIKERDSAGLLDAFEEFKRQFHIINEIYSIYSWLGIETWQKEFEEKLSNMIKREHLDKEREKVFYSVLKPWKKTALLEIQDKLKKGVSFKEIVDEYQFLRSWAVVWYRLIDEAWVKNIAEGNAKNQTKIEVYSLNELIKLLNPNAEERGFLEIAPYMIFLKDWRDDVRRFHAFSWCFLFEKIAEYFGVEKDDVGYLTINEISDYLNNGRKPKEIIEERKNGVCIIGWDKESKEVGVINKREYARYEEFMQEADQLDNKKEIKGLVVQTGKVTGRVVILHSYHDVKRVREGDIIVANTTHPNYLPAMHKAAAFVTNEGGITSHAAIVAREMHKPCIVGTKVATKILRDEDIVEVDANAGVVRIIKENQK